MEAGFPPQNRLGNMPHIPSPKEEDRSHSQPHKAGVGAAPPHTSSPSSFLFRAFKTAPPAQMGSRNFP